MPLSALLSHAWVAFTIAVDNAFEARMPHHTTRSDGPANAPWLVSHAMWWTCMRHVDQGGITVAELAARARTPTNLSGMVRWGYVALQPPPPPGRAQHPPKATIIRATRKGMLAREVWAPLAVETEASWNRGLGADQVNPLRRLLAGIDESLPPGLPDCLPLLGYGLTAPEPIPGNPASGDASLQAMLARALLSLTLDFERATAESLAIGANLLRLVEDAGTRVKDLSVKAGVSNEAVAVMTGLLMRRGLAEITTTAGARVLTLTPDGRSARAAFFGAIQKAEDAWTMRYRVEGAADLRAALEAIVTSERGRAFLGGVLKPPEGWRATTKGAGNLPWQPMVLHRGGYPDGS
jgi:hypothetical protein